MMRDSWLGKVEMLLYVAGKHSMRLVCGAMILVAEDMENLAACGVGDGAEHGAEAVSGI